MRRKQIWFRKVAPVALALVAGIGCRRIGSSTKSPLPLPFEFSGCASVDRGPICELGPSRTVLVSLGAVDRLKLHLSTDRGGNLVSESLRQAGEPVLERVTLPEGASELRLLLDDQPPRSGTLRIRAETRDPSLVRIREAKESGNLDAAEKAARALLDEGDPRLQSRVLGQLARIHLGKGEIDESVSEFERAVSLASKAGKISEAADNRFAAAFAMIERSFRFQEARKMLSGLDVADYPEGNAREPYYRGLLASATGDLRGARELFRQAAERAARLGMERLARTAKVALAVQLQQFGRAADSVELLLALRAEVVRAKDAGPCEPVEVANNLGLGLMLMGGEGSGVRADGVLQEAVRSHGGACKDPQLRAALLGSLALEYLRAGRASEADGALRDAAAASPEPNVAQRLSWLQAEGRLLLMKGDARGALSRFDRERDLAAAVGIDDERWLAEVGRARALEMLGCPRDALLAHRSAAGWLDRASTLVPLGGGRGAYLLERDASTGRAASLLLRMGKPEDAMQFLDRAWGRLLRGAAFQGRIERLEERERVLWDNALGAYRRGRQELEREGLDDWKLSAVDLRAKAASRAERENVLEQQFAEAIAQVAGELPTDMPPFSDPTLLVAELEAGPTAFFRTGNRATALRVEPTSAAWVDGWTHAVPRGPLSIIEDPRLTQMDLHARLGRSMGPSGVEHPLRLRTPSVRRFPESGRILIVANPSRNLPRASAEGARLAHALAERGFVVEELQGERARRDLVLSSLAHADALFFAGHGNFRGQEGWESSLELADGRVTVADILALAHVPARVMLSSCETGKSDSRISTRSLGVAQAFLLAGADFVFAPTRAVSDALAESVSSAVAEAMLEPDVRAGVVLERALEVSRRALPGEDWQAFRAFTP